MVTLKRRLDAGLLEKILDLARPSSPCLITILLARMNINQISWLWPDVVRNFPFLNCRSGLLKVGTSTCIRFQSVCSHCGRLAALFSAVRRRGVRHARPLFGLEQAGNQFSFVAIFKFNLGNMMFFSTQ